MGVRHQGPLNERTVEYSFSSSPPPARFYRPELDVLRFFAFVSVFVYHASLFSAGASRRSFTLAYTGAFGMCLFFVLSAYLITELLLREKANTGTIHIQSFYIRRILRIWPLYFAFIAFCILLGNVHRPWHLEPGLVLSFAALAGNWYLIYVPVGGPVMPLWSISLEEQFYLVWPRCAKRASTRALFWVSVAVILVSCTVVFFLSKSGASWFQIWWNSFAQFQFFAIGALLAFACHRWTPAWRAVSRMALFSCGLALWLAASFCNALNFTGVRPASSLVISYLLAGTGCVCIFLSFVGSPAHWWPKPLLYLGKISYGLYVFHMLSLTVAQRLFGTLPQPARAMLALAISTGFAALSYRYLEKPFLMLKAKFAFVRSRAA